MSKIWNMKDGTRIHVENMEDSHLINSYKMMERMIENGEGISVGWDIDDYDYSDEHLYDRINMLEEELLRRRLIE